jgi:glucokinase
MKEIVSVDIGGTHVRFAIAKLDAGAVVELGEAVTLETADFASFERAWSAFADRVGHSLPDAVAISFAGPVHGEVLKLTNNPWVIRPAKLPKTLNVEAVTLINDFSAVGHALNHVASSDLHHVCGPEKPLPPEGIITVIGPGTGLGVAHVLRRDGSYHVTETEGGHIDFAPLDQLEDRIVAQLRARYRRVSAERIVSGPGLNNIYGVLCNQEGGSHAAYEDQALWEAAIGGTDKLAVAALERFYLCFGAVAGDVALAQGGTAVVVAGGVGLRLADTLRQSGFVERFTAKGRFEAFMADIPVKVLTYPQPGLLGAAAAFALEHDRGR